MIIHLLNLILEAAALVAMWPRCIFWLRGYIIYLLIFDLTFWFYEPTARMYWVGRTIGLIILSLLYDEIILSVWSQLIVIFNMTFALFNWYLLAHNQPSLYMILVLSSTNIMLSIVSWMVSGDHLLTLGALLWPVISCTTILINLDLYPLLSLISLVTWCLPLLRKRFGISTAVEGKNKNPGGSHLVFTSRTFSR